MNTVKYIDTIHL